MNALTQLPEGFTSPGEVVKFFQDELTKLPQTVVFHTKHHFANGMYCRELLIPKNVLAVGKCHKQEHLFMVLQGTLKVFSNAGVQEFTAPAIVVSQPGIKRVVYAVDDVVCAVVHKTDNTNLDDIEEEVMEKELFSAYDSSNNLKVLEKQ